MWTPSLTPFAQMDGLVPKGLGASTMWKEGRKELEGVTFWFGGSRDNDALMDWARNLRARYCGTPLLTPKA